MKKYPLDQDLVIEDENAEIDVIIYCRASDDGFVYWGPLDCHRSIYKGMTLNQAKRECIEHYEKRYNFVEVIKVKVDAEALDCLAQ